MSILSNPRRLSADEYPKEYQALINQLGSTLNNFMEEVVSLSEKNIGYENLTRGITEFQVQTTSTGKFPPSFQVQTGMGFVRGCNVVDAKNVNNLAATLTAAPYCNFIYQGDGVITISSITGLSPNTKYNIVMELIP